MTAWLSTEEVAAREAELLGELYRRSFAAFFRAAWPIIDPTRPLMPSVAVDAVCAALQAVADGRIKRLAISMPPGTGKSKLVAVAFPAWLLLRSIGRARVMVGSYSFDFAKRDSQFCRDLVKSDWYRGLVGGAWEIRDDNDNKDDWWTSTTGRRLVTSVKGKSTGERCTMQIIDDALNAADTFSNPAKLEAIRWVNEVLPSRLEDQRNDQRIIVGQRLAVDDPISDVLRKNWRYLCLPAVLSEGDEPCVLLDDRGVEVWRDTRAIGQPIVDLLDTEALRRLEHDELGPTAFAAQYLQRPHDDSTAMFKRSWLERRWTDEPEFDRMVVTLDASFKESKGADYAVIQAWGALGGDRYLVDQWRKQAGYVETTEMLRTFAARYPFAKILVEEAANGHAVIDQLGREFPGIVGIKANEGGGGGMKGKQGRAASVQAIVASGAIVLPANAPWLGAWLDEICGFPGGTKNDDQVDAMVYALRDLQESGVEMLRAATAGLRALLR